MAKSRRFVLPMKVSVGRKRIPSTDDSSFGEFQRSVSEQVRELVENFRAWTSHMENVSADVVYDALEPTFRKSQSLVPVDTGDLKASGYLEKVKFRGRAEIEIGYARGGNPDYAVFVHERLDIAHAPPTQAKFLQQPLEEDADDIVNAIQMGMKEAAGV